VYVPLLLPLIAFLKRARVLVPGWWLYAFALPLGVNEVLLKSHFPERHDLINDWYILVHYLLLTGYGVVLASMRGAWDWLAHKGAPRSRVSVLVTGAVLVLIERGMASRDTPLECMLANMCTWCW